jgi:hypothetical protein
MTGIDRWGRARRVGRRVGVGAAAAVFGLVVVGAAATVVSRPRSASPAAEVTTGTVAVTRGTVAERQRFSGTLGFEGTYPVVHQGGPGILTAIAETGATVGRGGTLYAVANQPVRLLYGATPAYRDLASGVTAGPDVRQLEENLVALGMDPGRQIVVDERFTAATAAAVRRWQTAWGLPAGQRTGVLPQGSVVFAPGALRVNEAQAAVGAALAPGAPVLTATSTNRAVLVELPVQRQSAVHVGDQVQVSVNGIPGTSAGRIARIGRTATAPSQDQQRDGRPEGPATVTVTIQVTLPPGSPDLDQAPVGVLITNSTRTNVLLVPVVALLPGPGGGYQVRLATGEFVDVKPGVYDELSGSVEVTGNLTPGQLVQVPR